MKSMIFILAWFLPVLASAQEAEPARAEIDAAIERGLAFLSKDALAWIAEYDCASCHHASLVVCAMREAKAFGHAVDEAVLADLAHRLANSGDGKFSAERPAEAPHAASPKAMYFALALGSDPQPDEAAQAGLKLLLKTVKAEQTENGFWAVWPSTRPPLFGKSDESLTLLATLALLPAAAAGDEEAKTARDKSLQWLTETKSDDDPQSVALRVVLLSRLGRPAAESQTLVQRIKDRQNADGGWSQTTEMASDAWATGQALYALAAAEPHTKNPIIARGQAFLIASQREDGSWPMTSRPTKPGDEGATNLVPITGAGSAWAVLGLVRSSGTRPGELPQQ